MKRYINENKLKPSSMENSRYKGLPICRACLTSALEYIDMESPLFLYENDGFEETFTYLDCFNHCTQLTASAEDGHSKYLCSSCGLELKTAYEFIVKARNSHDFFQNQYETDLKPSIADAIKHKITDEKNNISGIVNKHEVKKELTFDENNSSEVKYEVTTNEASQGVGDTTFETEFIISEINNQLNDESNDVESNGSISLIIEESEENEDNEEEDYEKCNESEEIGGNFLVHRCEICSEKFRIQPSLQQHYKVDHAEYTLHYACDQCDSRFFSKSARNLHVKRIHLKVEYEDCTLCGRTVLKTWLDKHIRKQHEKKQEYLCSSCPRIFKNSTSLKKHMQTHQQNRERKFQCTECDKKFYTIENYRVHQAIHVEPSERKAFECSLCDKTFIRNTNLKLHMQMHRGETMDCPYCAKKFVRKKDMEIHIRFHTGDYPFKCSFCDKRYAIKGHLKYHERKHSGYKYKCGTCTKEFVNMSGLRQHSYEHTGMPLFCMICSKGFPSRFKVKRHIRSVHHIDENVIDELIIAKENSAQKHEKIDDTVNEEEDDDEEEEEIYEEIFLVDELDL